MGMNNKYSLVVNRIRLLNEERRKFLYEKQKNKDIKKRHKSIDEQILRLNFRMALIRNAVFSYSLAVAFFIVSSVMIGWNNMTNASEISWLVMISFLIGMIFVFTGIIFAAIEVWKGYKIITIEISDRS